MENIFIASHLFLLIAVVVNTWVTVKIYKEREIYNQLVAQIYRQNGLLLEENFELKAQIQGPRSKGFISPK